MIGGLAFLALVLGVGVLTLAKLVKTGQRPKDAPPGPPTLPLLGNLHLVHMSNVQKDHARTY